VLRLTRLPGVADKDVVRLAMLYALRFESDTQRVRSLCDHLADCGVRERAPALFAAVQAVLSIAGESERAGDLYASRSMLSKALTMFRGLKGVENVYTQHTPLLAETLSLLSQDKLEITDYPYMAGSNDDAASLAAQARRRPPREVIVFIVGGSTYEEHKAVAEWNARNPGCRVLLGGSALLNSDALLAALTA
jgi:vacuolar protein sorting-associated protein 45